MLVDKFLIASHSTYEANDSIWYVHIQCQGGDFTRGNGTGGESIYGEKFAVSNNFATP